MIDKITRRDVIKAGGIVSATTLLSIKVGATESDNVELNADVSIPSNTAVSVRIFEDTNNSGSANRQQEIDLDDGINTYIYDALTGFSGQGYEYWCTINLEGDGNATPIINSLTITLPDDEPEIDDPTQEWYDDFSDGNIAGWNAIDNVGLELSNQSQTGNYSLHTYTTSNASEDTGGVIWDSGPVLDLSETFEISGVIRQEHSSNAISSQDDHARIGVGSEPDQEGLNAFIMFNGSQNLTYLGDYWTAEPPTNTGNTIQTSFENTWISFRMESVAGSETVRAKVWEYGANEPENWQLEETFTGVSGPFITSVGNENRRDIWVDEITIQGEQYVPEEDENLLINARNFVVEGEATPYEIKYNDPENGWVDITNSVDSIQSDNSNIVSVNEQENQFEGISRGETFIIVNHEDIESGHQISTGNIVIGDIGLLPPSRKIQAVFGDTTSQVIFASTAVGLFMTKLMTSYGNSKNTWISLGTAFSVILLAGFQGWVSNGIVFAALFFVIISSILISNVRQNEVSVVQQGDMNE